MELYKELLAGIVSKKVAEIEIDCTEAIKSECYRILSAIHEIIADDSLDDRDCFMAIEKIICLFEDNGISCGSRHDF